MSLLQDFLVLNDNDPEQRNRGAMKSLALLNRTAMQFDDNLICIWVQREAVSSN